MSEKNYDGFTMIQLQEELKKKKTAFSDKDDRKALLKKLKPKK